MKNYLNFENDIKNLEISSIKFSRKYKNKLLKLNDQSILRSLNEYESIEEKIVSIKSFAFLTYCTDQLNKNKTMYNSKIQ